MGRLSGSGEFGQYLPTETTIGYWDMGFWTATVPDGTWSGNRLNGTLSGEFLTFKKYGTIEGELLGTYDGDHSWQAVGAGTWQKQSLVTNEGTLYFSSAVGGRIYDLVKTKTGMANKDSQNPSLGSYYYSYGSDETRSKRYGSSTFTDNAKRVNVRYDIPGPSNNYLKEVWTEIFDAAYPSDPTKSKYTYVSTTFDNEADYLSDMISTLETEPDWGDGPVSISCNTYYQADDDSDVYGIMGGIGDLWANLGSATATSLKFMGSIDKMSDLADTYNLFTSSLLSFNPLVNPNPYADSQTPDGAGGRNGAYWAYLGSVIGTPASPSYDGYGMETRGLSAGLQGMFFNNSGQGGIIYSDNISGTYYPDLGYWKATGNAFTYQMTDATDTTTLLNSGWTPATFVNLINQTKVNSYGMSFGGGTGLLGGLAADLVDSGAVSLLSSRGEDVTFGAALPIDRRWKIEQTLLGGGYAGSPRNWVFNINDPVIVTGEGESATYSANSGFIQATGTDYIGVKIGEPTDSTFSGNLLGVNADWTSAMAYVKGGIIKGTFDPVRSTWKAVNLGTIMSVDGFLNRVEGMGDTQRAAFEKATKIPAFEVGRVNLSLSDNAGNTALTAVNMNNVTFFTTATDAGKINPILWATKEINGTFTATPVLSTNPVKLTGVPNNGGAINATFNPVKWETNIWGATVQGGGTMKNPSNTTLNIQFKGAATGTKDMSTSGNFGTTANNNSGMGVGAGLVKTTP